MQICDLGGTDKISQLHLIKALALCELDPPGPRVGQGGGCLGTPAGEGGPQAHEAGERQVCGLGESLGESAEVGAKIKTNFDFGTILSRGSEERTLLSHSKSLPESHWQVSRGSPSSSPPRLRGIVPGAIKLGCCSQLTALCPQHPCPQVYLFLSALGWWGPRSLPQHCARAPRLGDWACSVAARVVLPGKPLHALPRLLPVASSPPAAPGPSRLAPLRATQIPARPRPQPVRQRWPPLSSLRAGADRVNRRGWARSQSAWGRRRWRPACRVPGPAELSAAAGVQVSSSTWGRPWRSRGSRGECPWRRERWRRGCEAPCELRCVWGAAGM